MNIYKAVFKVIVGESYLYVKGIALAIWYSNQYNGDFQLKDYSRIALTSEIKTSK